MLLDVLSNKANFDACDHPGFVQHEGLSQRVVELLDLGRHIGVATVDDVIGAGVGANSHGGRLAVRASCSGEGDLVGADWVNVRARIYEATFKLSPGLSTVQGCDKVAVGLSRLGVRQV